MELLDLPPEMIDRIVHLYVNDAGVVEAWKKRNVCRVFASYIRHEIVAKQPMQAILKIEQHSRRGFMQHIAPEILSSRVKSLNGANSFLPDLVRQEVDGLMELSEDDDRATRDRYTDILCEVVAKTCKSTTILLVRDPSSKEFSKCARRYLPGSEVDAVSAASAVGNIRILEDLLSAYPRTLRKESSLFGTPLAAACMAGQVDSFKALEQHLRFCDGRAVVSAISAAFEAALYHQDNPIIPLLLKFYIKIAKSVTSCLWVLWLRRSVHHNNIQAVRALLNLPLRGGDSDRSCAALRRTFQSICEKGKATFACAILDEIRKDKEDRWGCLSIYHTIAERGLGSLSGYLLVREIGSRDILVSYPRNKFLSAAISKGEVDLVRLIIATGADVTKINNAVEWIRPCTTSTEKSEILGLLNDAKRHALRRHLSQEETFHTAGKLPGRVSYRRGLLKITWRQDFRS